MKSALLALAILSLAGCHVGSNKDALPSDQNTASAPAADKTIEKSRDAMLGKSMKVDSEHWAAAPAAASSAAPTPTDKSDAGHAAPAIPSTSAIPAKGG